MIVANRLVLFRGTKLGHVYIDFRGNRDYGSVVVNAMDSISQGTGRSAVAAAARSWFLLFLFGTL